MEPLTIIVIFILLGYILYSKGYINFKKKESYNPIYPPTLWSLANKKN